MRIIIPMLDLKFFWKKWLRLAHAIGNFQGQVILTLFYFSIMVPLGVGVRLFSDFLGTKPRRLKSNFRKWDHPVQKLEEARKQF